MVIRSLRVSNIWTKPELCAPFGGGKDVCDDGSVARLTRLSRSVAGSRVLITGAGSGMGRATAHLFADEGARVFCVDWDGSAVDDICAEIEALYGPGNVGGASADVSHAKDRSAFVADMVARWGGVDVLINNAGISRLSTTTQDDESFAIAWESVLAVNVSAHVHLVRECLSWLVQAPHGGRVVNVASTEAFVATPGLVAYTASKHAVIGVTRSLAVELGRKNVTVNAICPGPILTQMTDPIPDAAKDKYARRKVPVGRYGDPEEVAHMTLSLCLPAASFVNGAALVVDGGMSVSHT